MAKEKFHVEVENHKTDRRLTIIVEASSEQEAEQKARQMPAAFIEDATFSSTPTDLHVVRGRPRFH